MNRRRSRRHCKVNGWHPHVPLANGLRGVGEGVGDGVVATRHVFPVDFVVPEHVRLASSLVCTDHDGVGFDVVANFPGRSLRGSGFIGRRRQNGVDDMDDAVARSDIGGCYGGVTDLHGRVGDREGGIVAVEHRDREAIGYAGGLDGALGDVVEENIAQGGVGFVVVKLSEVNTRSGECRIGGCKDRERSVGLERLNQPSVDQSRNE